MLKEIINKLKKNKILNNVLAIGVFRGIGILTNFFMVGIIYRYFNNSELNGIWMTVFSILTWITLCDFGMGNGLRNKLTAALTEKRYELARKYISTTYVIMIIPVAFMIILGVIIACNINWLNVFTLKSINLTNNYLKMFFVIIFVLYIINFYLTIIYAIMHSLFKSYIISIIQVITNSVNIVIILVLIKIGYNDLIVLGIVYMLSSISVLIIYTISIFGGKYKKIAPNIKYFDNKLIKDITGIGIKFLVLQFCIIILFSTDNLIISKFIGVESVTTYQLINKLLGIFTIALGVILVPIWTSIIQLKTKKKYNYMKRLILKVIIIFFILSIGVIFIGILSPLIISIWVGEKLIIDRGLIILMIIYVILNMWCDLFQSVLNGLNKLKYEIISYTIAMIINIPISILLVNNTNLGIGGVILGTIVSLSIPSIILPIVTIKYLKKK